jgi:thioredoxin reductase (NADPH)
MAEDNDFSRPARKWPAGGADFPAGAQPNPVLTAEQISRLRAEGQVRPMAAGEVLFREGDRAYDFIVVLEGRVMIIDHEAGTERRLAIRGQGQFSVELALLTGERLFTSAVVLEPGTALIVPVARLQALISQDHELGQLIVHALLARREWLVNSHTGLRVVGSRSAPQARRLLEFAVRNRLPHVWLDSDTDPAADAVLAHEGISRDQLPVVVMRGGEVLSRPSNAELARAAGIGTSPAPGVTYDVAIIGAGPAGLAAAVYGASEGLSTALVEALAVGGQLGTSSRIENYLGFPVGVRGGDFAQGAYLQVLRFGASVVLPASAVGLSGDSAAYLVQLDTGETLPARTLIIATGVAYRKIDAAGLDQFSGLGVFYTPVAAHDEVRPGGPVVIVGGGNSAGQAAIALAGRGHHVTMAVRDADLAPMSHYLVERITGQPDIDIRYRTVVHGLSGSRRLERVEVEDITTGKREALPAAALFVLIGAEPHTDWLAGSLVLDEAGFVVTGLGLGPRIRDQTPWTERNRDPYLLETSRPGVFAAGDIRSGSTKRASAAVGDGSVAIRFVIEYLSHARLGEQPGRVGPGEAEGHHRAIESVRRLFFCALHAAAAAGGVEGLGIDVLLKDPQEQPGRRRPVERGPGGQRHQPGADPCPLPPVGDVQVVQQAAPAGIIAEDHVREASQRAVGLGDDRARRRVRGCQPPGPLRQHELIKAAIKERVGQRPPVMPPPAVAMQPGDGGRVLSHGFPEDVRLPRRARRGGRARPGGGQRWSPWLAGGAWSPSAGSSHRCT